MDPRVVSELNRHFDQLCRAQYLQYKDHLRSLVGVLKGQPAFASIMTAIAASEPDFDPDDWLTRHLVNPNRGRHRWPDTEPRRLKVFVRSLDRMTGEDENPVAWGQKLATGGDFNVAVERVTDEIVKPVLEYIQGCFDGAQGILHVLGRFQRQVEWFEQADLYEAYTKETRKGEDVYDKRLRRYLFESGIDFPYSKPRSASGKADIIAQLGQDDHLVCEVKLFDNVKYKVPYLAKGVRQAIRYAHDYNKALAYLVVVNLSDLRLTFPNDGPPNAPPRLNSENVTLFLVSVHGKPRPSASEEKKVETLIITKDQLVFEAEASGDVEEKSHE